jgi:aerobic carbon-monoxide dehydrogenase medium subunit
MKSAAFDYSSPSDVATASALLAQHGGAAKPVGGGQSLTPMMNLRLVQPELLIDLRAVSELRACREEADAVVLGAGVTHAMIEDNKVPDPTHGFLARVAGGIAYRAVRNQGTLGGSLVHADPAADWISTMRLLDAQYLVRGPRGERSIASADFMQAAFTTALSENEILIALRIPRCSPQARLGYYKFCRKVGEFADAIGAVLIDSPRGVQRAVIGATAGAPYAFELSDAALQGAEDALWQGVLAAGCEDGYEAQVHFTALQRALKQAVQEVSA